MCILPDQIQFLKVLIFTLTKVGSVQLSHVLKCKCPAGQMVYTVRQRCGRQLAIEAPTDADVVSTVPESATPAALGYAQQVALRGVVLFYHLLDLSSHPFLLVLPVWASVHRGSVQEPLCWQNIYSAQHSLEAARGGQEVWGSDRQLCREACGAD